MTLQTVHTLSGPGRSVDRDQVLLGTVNEPFPLRAARRSTCTLPTGVIACAVGWSLLVAYHATPLMAHGPSGVCGVALIPMIAACCGHCSAMCLAMLPASAPRPFAAAWPQLAGWIVFGTLLIVTDATSLHVLHTVGDLSLIAVAGFAVAGTLAAVLVRALAVRVLSAAACCLSMIWCFYRESLVDMACLTLAVAGTNVLAAWYAKRSSARFEVC